MVAGQRTVRDAAAKAECALIARNLRFAMRAYSRSTARGETVELDGAWLINSGVNYGVFNAAVFYGDFTPCGWRLAGLVESAAEYYRRRKLAWSCWICPDLVDAPLEPEIDRLMTRYRLHCIAEHRAMVSGEVLPCTRALPPVEISRVFDVSTRLDFVAVSTQVFALPHEIASAIYASESFWTGGLIAWVGYHGARPICTAATETSEGVVGIYSVATIPEFQRLGYGERMTRHAVSEASRATRLDRSILQSTREGFSLYRKMGFRPVGRFAVYLSR